MASRAPATAEVIVPFPLIAFLLSAAVLSLPASPRSRPALAGLPAFWLGLGALRVVLAADGTGDLAAAISGAPPPLHFLEITAALLVIGLGSVLWSGVVLGREDRSFRGRTSAALAIGAVLMAVVLLWPLWHTVHLAEMAGVAVGLVVGAVGAWGLAGALGLRAIVLRADRWLGSGRTTGVDSTDSSRVLTGGLALSIGLALIPNAGSLLAGTLAAAVFLHLIHRRRRLVPAVPVLVLTTLGLVPVGWLLLTVAGTIAPSLVSLRDAPLSPAAALWITPWLLFAVWGLLGQWPVQSLVPAPCLAALGGLLVVRIGVAAIPDGLAGFQAVVAPLVVLSLWWAVATARLAMGLSALGLFGALAVPESGFMLLLLLFGAATLAVLTERILPDHRTLIGKGLALMAAIGVWPVVESGLHTQVVYTVCCAAALTAAGASTGRDSPYHP